MWISFENIDDAQALNRLEKSIRKQINAKTVKQEQKEAENKPEVIESISESEPTVENKSQPTSLQIPSSSLQVFEFDVVTLKVQQSREVQRSGLFGLKEEVKISSNVTLNRSHSQAQYFTENLGNNISLDMVYIPGGKFIMGSPLGEGYDRERPQHEVTVQPFFMGKYPITQAQWKAIADRADLKVERILDPNPAYFKDRENSARRPVENVDWDDAVEFCQRLSKQTGTEYRLPTEAEWEYACRAGTTTPYYFGENITDKLANYGGNVGKTTSVGQFPPNAFGLYDMHGNVWEWCQDDWHDSYKNAPNDGSAWVSETSSTKVTRGGSWGSNPTLCRSAPRDLGTRGGRDADIGFRVVCVVPRTT